MKPFSFIKIQGIEGESQDAGHEKWIDVLSWDWGCSQSGAVGAGSHGRARSRGQMREFKITKPIDRSSPALAYNTMIGQHVGMAEFHTTKAGDDGAALVYCKFLFEGVLITGYSTGGQTGGDLPVEEVSFVFNKVTYTYVEQTGQGSGGAKPEMEWFVPEARGSIA